MKSRVEQRRAYGCDSSTPFSYYFLVLILIDVNECTVHRPCKNGATCVNTVGGYSCRCPANYKGKHCDEG